MVLGGKQADEDWDNWFSHHASHSATGTRYLLAHGICGSNEAAASHGAGNRHAGSDPGV